MSVLARHLDTLYFDYRGVAGHEANCSRHGTDLWEVTRHRWESYSGDKTELVLRMACFECGVVHFERADTDLSSETTHARQVGYASKPEKVAGLWLWPGPHIWYGDDRGPTSYLVTASKDRPRKPEDVAGKVGWCLGPRGGVRWSAGIGCTGHGTVLRAAEQTWPSRKAAVAWIHDAAVLAAAP